jgi:hypothetical protein
LREFPSAGKFTPVRICENGNEEKNYGDAYGNAEEYGSINFQTFCSGLSIKEMIFEQLSMIRSASGGKGKAGKNILPGQLGEIGNNFVMRHVSRQPPKDVVNRDTGILHAGFSEAFFGIDPDNVIINVHSNLLQDKYGTKLHSGAKTNF